eukprot:gene20057-22795_t
MSVYPYLVGAFLTARIAQRVYFLWNGHECFFASFLFQNKLLNQKGQKSLVHSYSSHVESLFRRPRDRLARFFADNNIQVTNHSIRSSVDGTTLRYKRLGTGKKMILLANGVGTDLYMWLPVLQYLCSFRRNFFEDYTVVASTYRGLFGENDDAECSAGKKHQDIEVTIDNLVEDIMDIKKHADVKTYECIIGWSTGSQVALACTAKYPSVSETLFLLNLSTGLTLHTLFQLILPLPMFLQRYASRVFIYGFSGILSLVDTAVWDAWRSVAHSPYYRLAFGIFAFLGGFPPEMAIYFDEYNHEIFTSRTHTASLGKLILALDEPCSFQDP